MGEESFKGLVIGFILIGLFLLAMFTFAQEIIEDYRTSSGNYTGNLNLSSSKITGGAIDVENLTAFLGDVKGKGKTQDTTFKKKGLFSIGGSDILTGIWDVTVGVGTMITLPFFYISSILGLILKVPDWVIYVIEGILFLVIIFGIWRLIKSGS